MIPIPTKAELKELSPEALSALTGEIREQILTAVSKKRRASRLQSRSGRDDGSAPSGA